MGAVLAILVWAPLAYAAVRVQPGEEDAPHLYGFLVVQALIAFALVLWAIRCFTQRPFRLLWPPVCWGVVAFIIYAIWRCQHVDIEYLGPQQLLSVILYGALFFLVLNNFTRKESATIVAVVLIALGTMESVWAFYQFASHNPRVWAVLKPAGYALRGSGSYVNPNSFAGMIELILPLALVYTAMARVSAAARVVFGYAALVMMGGIVVSASVGGNAAMIATVAVFCVILLCQEDYWKRGLVALGTLTLVSVVLFLVFSGLTQRIEAKGGITENGDGRKIYWTAAEQLFHQHFLWGIGPGHFKYEYPMWAPFWGQVTLDNAHNDYLTTLCEWGFVGFALVIITVGLLYMGIAAMWPSLRRKSNDGKKNSSKTAFVLGAALGLFSILIHSEVDFNMQIPANACIAVTLMALLAAQWRFATERFWFNPGRIGKVILAIAALGTAGFLGVRGVQAGTEFYWVNQSLNPKATWDQEVAGLKKAHEIDPRNYLTLYELGECYRGRALQGDPGNEALAAQAMDYYKAAMNLNHYDSWSPMRYGMCLDWLDRSQEANPYFTKTLTLRPNNSTLEFYLGRHSMEVGNYPLAKMWFEYADWAHPPSDLAKSYLKVVEERLANPSHR
jgi:O-antigen ligase